MKDYGKIAAFIAMIVWFAVTVYFGIWEGKFPSRQTHERELANWCKEMEYEGKVIKKYLDTANHYSRTILLVDSLGEGQSIIDNFDNSGFYDYVNAGDSIVKEKESLDVTVFRDGRDTVFNIRFEFQND